MTHSESPRRISILSCFALAISLIFLGCSTDGSTETDGDADGDTVDNPSETETNPDGDEESDECLPGFTKDPILGSCIPIECPEGQEWNDILNLCLPVEVDGDDEIAEEIESESEERESPMTECRSSDDCPNIYQCGSDGYCSEWASGNLGGWVETLVEAEHSYSFSSPGFVKGKFRGQGLRIGMGSEAWIETDMVSGSQLCIQIYDRLSDRLYNVFLLKVDLNSVEEGATVDYAPGVMSGFFHRLEIEPEEGTILGDENLGEVLAGRIVFSVVRVEDVTESNTGLITADFHVYLGPVQADLP